MVGFSLYINFRFGIALRMSTFFSMLTTMAFYYNSSRRFETCSCKQTPSDVVKNNGHLVSGNFYLMPTWGSCRNPGIKCKQMEKFEATAISSG